MKSSIQFPPLMLPFKLKGKKWRKLVIDWADANGSYDFSPVRKTVRHKKINYDLVNGIIHFKDVERVVNPEGIKASFISAKIPHYPIINSKLNVLIGEESKRVFDFKVIVTNPTAISEKENNKKQELFARLQELIQDTSISEEQLLQKLLELNNYYNYQWLDLREIRANALINHYMKEYNINHLFNKGFMDALTVAEEIYLCDIVGGEPIIEKLDPRKVRSFRSGSSSRIEDSDMIIIEDYWNPGKIMDYYHKYLTEKDIKHILNLPYSGSVNNEDGYEDPRDGFVYKDLVYDDGTLEYTFSNLFDEHGYIDTMAPYDFYGNIKVLRVYWKSFRKIKKVKSYNPLTGETEFNFYPETYIINETLGEEEEVFYINEAWEGVKIGKDIYIKMHPRTIQYNRLSNPSRCHFGIIGTIYNLNGDKPYSMVDMMKPFNYYYDVIHDRLNKLMFRNWGKILQMDLAKIPKGWDAEKWMHFAKTNGIAVIDSYKEGNIGSSTGVLAGSLNNASSGVIDAELGNSILFNISLLEYIKSEMSDVVGISRQREGLISNRETVGGVERATLQSSHITEWYFVEHEALKKRVLECFLETAKIALKGDNKKFQYILSDYSQQIINIDGDEFAEADYGLVVDNSQGTLELAQKLDMLALAALLNQLLSFSTVMKLYTSSSLAEKQRMVEKDELNILERNQQQQLQQLLVQQQLLQIQQLMESAKMLQEDMLNQRDNETKIIIATLNAESKNMDNIDDGIEEPMSEEAKEKLKELIRLFNERLELDKLRLQFDKDKAKTDAELKRKQINKLTINK